jgi:hypothetical protein
MRAFRESLILVITVLAAASARAQESDAVWKKFRKVHPYHHQALVLSEPSKEGGRYLLVSEPPPHVTVDGLRACAPDVAAAIGDLIEKIEVKKHPIGHDGWVKDIVLTLKSARDTEIGSFVDKVHHYLFSTTYKVDCLDLLPEARAGVKPSDLDRKITAVELRKWLFEDRLTFRPIEGGEVVTAEKILADKRSGVFQGGDGLVLWGLPRGVSLAGHRARARQFAVESDLVVGAVADANHLVIVGRQRSVPVSILPPLRVETLEVLASAKTDHLAQSYERNRIFAGRFVKGWDWAPIYLSPELLNTEYGSLLNITDQMLKSWSLSGLIEYERFDYPKPAGWPFARPLVTELKARSLTFNWNTASAGYMVESSGLKVFALNRTGALPVSYFPDSAAKDEKAAPNVGDYEQKAYGYFAELSDPNLVRVAEYAAIYQLFRALAPNASEGAPATDAQIRALAALAAESKKAVKRLSEASDATLDELATEILGKGASKESRLNFLVGVKAFRKDIQDVVDLWGEVGLDDLATALADPRKVEQQLPGWITEVSKLPMPGMDEAAAKAAIKQSKAARLAGTAYLALELTQSQDARDILTEFADVPGVKGRYARAFADQPDGWVRTPSIVVSRATGELVGCTGGHNLDARIVLFREGKNVTPGQVKLVPEGNKLFIEYHKQDLTKLPNLLRTAGRKMDNARLKGMLDTQLGISQKLPPRPSVEALYADARVPEAPAPRASAAGGWKPVTGRDFPKNISALLEQARSDPSASVVLVERLPAGFRVIGGNGTEVLEARSYPSMIELIEAKVGAGSKGKPVQLHLVDFQAHEADGLVSTLRLRAGTGGKPRVISRRLKANNAGDIKLSNYDFKAAKVKEITVAKERIGGIERDVATATVEVPAQTAGKPSLLARFRFFLHGVTEAVQAKVTAALKVFLGRKLSNHVEVFDALDGLRSDLKQFGVEVEMEFSSPGEWIDSYQVRLERGGSHDGNAHHPARHAA